MATGTESSRNSLPEGHWYLGVFLDGYAQTLLQLQRFEDSEKALVAAQGIFEAAFWDDHNRTVDVIKSLVNLYAAWHEAEPDAGHDAQAPEWQAKLDAIKNEAGEDEDESEDDDPP